jgi:hypothetical protein
MGAAAQDFICFSAILALLSCGVANMSAFAGPSFSLEGVDDKSHPYLRGIRGVSQILQASSASAKKINDVYFSRPHMFIIFNEYKRLLAIDAAPTNLQANERQNQQIAKFLSGDVSELDSTLSSVLTSTHKTKIIDVFVYRGSPKDICVLFRRYRTRTIFLILAKEAKTCNTLNFM